jgi:Kef-type K+ transport system membrane component KefB
MLLVWGPHGLGLGWMDDAAFRYPVGILGIVGEVGLVMLLVQAGLPMDLHELQQVGMRAMVMALLGSDRSCRPSLAPSGPTPYWA